MAKGPFCTFCPSSRNLLYVIGMQRSWTLTLGCVFLLWSFHCFRVLFIASLFVESCSSSLVHRVLFIKSRSLRLVHYVLFIASCSSRPVHTKIPWVLTATRRVDPDSPTPSFTAVPQITNRVLYEAMPQESEHNMGDFEISLNTFPTL